MAWPPEAQHRHGASRHLPAVEVPRAKGRPTRATMEQMLEQRKSRKGREHTQREGSVETADLDSMGVMHLYFAAYGVGKKCLRKEQADGRIGELLLVLVQIDVKNGRYAREAV